MNNQPEGQHANKRHGIPDSYQGLQANCAWIPRNYELCKEK